MNNHIVFVILFFAGAFSVASGAILYPLFQGIQSDYAESLAKRQELFQLEEDQKRVHEFSNTLKLHQENIAYMNSLFLNVSAPVDFFRFLDTLAEQLSITLQKTPGTPNHPQGDAWPSLSIQIEGSGNFQNVHAFLQKVEHGPYLLKMQNLAISNSDNNVDFTALLKVYAQP